jgi:hypothetical protein
VVVGRGWRNAVVRRGCRDAVIWRAVAVGGRWSSCVTSL